MRAKLHMTPNPLLFAEGTPDRDFTHDDLRRAIISAMEPLGPRKRILLIPPDFTRLHSRAGEITRYLYDHFGPSIAAILPALGTHAPMTPTEIARMFPGVPASLFRIHNWRNSLARLQLITGVTEDELRCDGNRKRSRQGARGISCGHP